MAKAGDLRNDRHRVQYKDLSAANLSKATDHFIQLAEAVRTKAGAVVLRFPEGEIPGINLRQWTNTGIRPAPLNQTITPGVNDGTFVVTSKKCTVPAPATKARSNRSKTGKLICLDVFLCVLQVLFI